MKRYKRYLIFLFALTAFCFLKIAKSQNYCNYPTAFRTHSYPQSVDTFTVNVDTLINFYGDTFMVKLKFAVPVNDNLPFIKRPLIIGVHGGGFLSDYLIPNYATNGYNNTFIQMQYGYALMGWIGASLDYQTGFGIAEEQTFLNAISNPGSVHCQNVTNAIMSRFNDAAYRATVDCRKALDYICTNYHLFPFVDTNQVYLMGGSAGAITVLHAAFSERNEFYPNPASTAPVMAPKHKVAGVIAYAGAMTDSYNGGNLHHIDTGEAVPVFMGHGTADPIVPYNSGPIGSCPKSYYWHGSNSIATKLCSVNNPYELFLVDSGDHSVGSGFPVSNIMSTASLTFIRNRGLCPQQSYSSVKFYSRSGTLLDLDTCSNFDCNGDYGGHAKPDNCGVCSGGNTGYTANSGKDCSGKCNGLAITDSCGKCFEPADSQYNNSCKGCDGIINSGKIIDSCGQCLLPSDTAFNIHCKGCDGIINSGKIIDSCGQCLLPSDSAFNTICKGCDGIINSGKIIDSCGICLLPADSLFNQTCRGCDGELFSGKQIDSCGICLNPSDTSFNETCRGCDNVLFSGKIIDSCGICLQPFDTLFDNSCRGCDGILFSQQEYDTCGKCLHPSDSTFNNCGNTGLNPIIKPGTSVYPNPFDNKLTICVDAVNMADTKGAIYNVHGVRIYSSVLEKNCTEIDCQTWLPGIYFYSITRAGLTVYSGKIIAH